MGKAIVGLSCLMIGSISLYLSSYNVYIRSISRCKKAKDHSENETVNVLRKYG